MNEWYFIPHIPGQAIREAVQSDFFAADSISDPGKALIREGIQNSLDARRDDEKKVLVRIFLSGSERAIQPQLAEFYFKGLETHFKADDNGLRSENKNILQTPCPYILFEDYRTKGLQGDPTEYSKPKTKKNHFYHFFRSEGQTDKGVSDLGSKGVGKHVFLEASQIKTIFGLSVRADDSKCLLMGKTVLKSHRIGEDTFQDGYFGIPHPNCHTLMMPIYEKSEITSFSNLFDISRGSDSGLSILIPWPDQEITEEHLIKAVLSDYYYPILAKELEVIIETPSFKESLESNSLLSVARKIEKDLCMDISPQINLAIWAQSISDDDRFYIAKPDNNQPNKWDNLSLSKSQTDILRDKYLKYEYIAVRVPVTISRKGDIPRDSYFDIYLARDISEKQTHSHFIRNNLLISKVNTPLLRGIRSLVIINDDTLSEFLKTSENPSHTEWDHSRLRDVYKLGYRQTLDFVKRSVYEIIKMLVEEESEEDRTVLSKYFYMPTIEEPDIEESVPEQQEKKGDKPPITPIPPGSIKSNPKKYFLQRINGGFSIKLGLNNKYPLILKLSVAYDTRKGNPLKNYNPLDFDLNTNPIKFEYISDNYKIIKIQNNHAEIMVTQPDFHMNVSGFDDKRDLYTDVDIKEIKDGDSEI